VERDREERAASRRGVDPAAADRGLRDRSCGHRGCAAFLGGLKAAEGQFLQGREPAAGQVRLLVRTVMGMGMRIGMRDRGTQKQYSGHRDSETGKSLLRDEGFTSVLVLALALG